MVYERRNSKGESIFYVRYRRLSDGAWRSKRSGPDLTAATRQEQELAIQWQNRDVIRRHGDASLTRPPLRKLIRDFIVSLDGSTFEHQELRRMHIERTMKIVGDDLDRITETQLREAVDTFGLAPSTKDQYLSAVRAFFQWLLQHKWVERNPLEFKKRVFRKGRDEVRVRHALSLDDVRRLAEAASGPRGVLYYLAATTGLRLKELESLRWCDMQLMCPVPHIQLPGYRDGKRVTKNGQDAVIPVQPWVADMIQLPTRCHYNDIKDSPVFRIDRKHAADMIRYDAEKAGIKVPTKRHLDFHSLRKSTVRILHELHIPAIAIRDVMRHASLDTTMEHYHEPNLAALAAQTSIPDPR